MRKILFLFAIPAFALTLLTTSCGEDEDPVIEIPPSLDFLTDDANALNGPYPTTDFEVTDVNAMTYVGIEVVAGNSDITSLTISDDDGNLSTMRFSLYDLNTQTTETANNPLLILGDRVNGFKFEVGIDPQDDFSAKTYTFTVADKNGLSNSISITITTVDPGTPIEKTLTGVLLNQAGPAGQGSLDLDDGVSTGVTTGTPAIAEIRDMGVDPAIDPSVAENWRRQIGPMVANNVTVRVPGPNFPESFNFDDVATKEEIQAYFEDGDALPTTVNSVPASNPVNIGDVFLVERDGKYYIIQVADVRATSPFPPNANDDEIEFDIKY